MKSCFLLPTCRKPHLGWLNIYAKMRLRFFTLDATRFTPPSPADIGDSSFYFLYFPPSVTPYVFFGFVYLFSSAKTWPQTISNTSADTTRLLCNDVEIEFGNRWMTISSLSIATGDVRLRHFIMLIPLCSTCWIFCWCKSRILLIIARTPGSHAFPFGSGWIVSTSSLAGICGGNT